MKPSIRVTSFQPISQIFYTIIFYKPNILCESYSFWTDQPSYWDFSQEWETVKYTKLFYKQPSLSLSDLSQYYKSER